MDFNLKADSFRSRLAGANAVPKRSPSPAVFRMTELGNGSTDAFFSNVPYQADTPSMTLGSSSRSVSSPITFGSESFGENVFENFFEDTIPVQWLACWERDQPPSPLPFWSAISEPNTVNGHQGFTHSWISPDFDQNTARVHLINTTENHAPTILSQHRDQRIDVDIHEGNGEDDNDHEEEDDDDEDYDEYDEDEWSGQDNELEHTVIRALGGDLSLAVHLIPILHKSIFSELTTTVTQKVGPWRRGVLTSHGLTSTESEQTTSSNGRTDDSTSTSRKRQRVSNPSSRIAEAENEDERNDDEHDDSDDGRQDPKRRRSIPTSAVAPLLPRLACPFYKRDPVRYSAQSIGDSKSTTKYRPCTGPGFHNIQRLKEHLKRKHYPVQCERCYDIFSGPDRSASVRALEAHRQLDVPCELKSPSLKEGISEAKWVALDNKRGKKTMAESSRIEKWFEIWTVLFPEIPPPETPWYENEIHSQTLPPPSRESSAFAELFSAMLDHQVNQQHICFLQGSEDVMKSRIETLVQKAFSLYVGINEPPTSTNSSSSRSQTQSLSILGSSLQPTSTSNTKPSWAASSRATSTVPSTSWIQGPSLHTTNPSVVPTGMSMGPPSMLPPLSHVTQDYTPSQHSFDVLPNISNHSIHFPRNEVFVGNGSNLPTKDDIGEPEMDLTAPRGRQKSI